MVPLLRSGSLPLDDDIRTSRVLPAPVVPTYAPDSRRTVWSSSKEWSSPKTENRSPSYRNLSRSVGTLLSPLHPLSLSLPRLFNSFLPPSQVSLLFTLSGFSPPPPSETPHHGPHRVKFRVKRSSSGTRLRNRWTLPTSNRRYSQREVEVSKQK